jgi:leader peptidase (prepilin peptidase)/N-methyltransferase
MEAYLYFLVGLLGLSIGSFLNVIIYRLPRKMIVRRGRSVCPHCGHTLRWYHNVPLFSYLLLRGKCAFCKGRISIRYPLVEFLNCGLYLYFYWLFGMSVGFLGFAFLASALLAIFFIDLDFQIIPDLITLPGMVLGLALAPLPGGIGIAEAAIGLLVGSGALYLIALLGDWLFKKESMGGGDIKMAAMLGAFLGWEKIVLIFIASAVIGLVISVVVMSFSARLRRERIVPFGPFLALAAMLAILYGDPIIDFYLVAVVGIH